MLKLHPAWLLAYVIAGSLPLSAQSTVPASQPAQSSAHITSAARPAAGGIHGRVLNDGKPQAGIAVAILGANGKLLQKIYSGADGSYRVDRIQPGSYTAAVMQPNFLPFWKSAIDVIPGAEVLLDINLLSLAESMQIGAPDSVRDSAEAWKWVLRSGSLTRPVLRFQPELAGNNPGVPRDPGQHAVRGSLQFLAGNQYGFGEDPGLRTSFDMAYARHGDQWFGLAGSAGWERGTPAGSLRGTWNRISPDGSSSTLSFAVRQLVVPGVYVTDATGVAVDSGHQAVSGTAGYQETRRLSDRVQLQYGSFFDVMNFDGRADRWSPFTRVVVTPADGARLTVAYTAADPHTQQFDGDPEHSANEQWLAVPPLSAGPAGRPVLEGGHHAEVQWEQDLTSNIRYQAAAFYDDLSNTALSLALPGSPALSGELLQDPLSNRYFLSADPLISPGMRLAMLVALSGHTELIAGYDYSGSFQPTAPLVADSAQNLRELLGARLEHSLVVKVKSQLPRSNTEITSSYRWLPRSVASIPDPYDHGWSQSLPYLNVLVVQPIRSPYIFQGQFRAVAEFDNLLAQGYLPLRFADGDQGYLFSTARAFRGGLSFVF